MDKTIIKMVNCWLSNAPESYHDNDNERLFAVVKYAYTHDLLDDLNSIELEELVRAQKPHREEEDFRKFVEEWDGKISLLADLLTFMQEDGTIPDYRLR